MMAGVQIPQSRTGNMGVDLGRRKIGVAQQKLNDAQIGTVVEHVGRERMAQFMR